MKKYAIEVFFNEEFDTFVRDLWLQCDVRNLSSFMNQVNGTEPHIAFAVYENIEIEQLRNSFIKFIEQEIESTQLIFDVVACFPTTKVSFLQPNVNKEFIDLMMKIHTHFQKYKSKCNSYYQPERWFPHVTIGYNKNNEELMRTLSFIMENFIPQTALVDRLVLVEIEYVDNKVICRNIVEKKLSLKEK